MVGSEADLRQNFLNGSFVRAADLDPDHAQRPVADVLKRLPDMPVSRVRELLPWNWKTAAANVKTA